MCEKLIDLLLVSGAATPNLLHALWVKSGHLKYSLFNAKKGSRAGNIHRMQNTDSDQTLTY